MANLQLLADAVIGGNQAESIRLTNEALEENVPPKEILDGGLIAGMEIVGVRFKANEVYVPEVLIAARAMKSAMEILEPKLAEAGVEALGKAVIGTVQGDLQDNKKNLVVMMLKGSGFEVHDIGVDQSPEQFVAKAKEINAEIVGLSALLTTTMSAMEKTVAAVRNSELSCKVMIGGAPVTQNFADQIGADGYSADAASAVDLAKELLKNVKHEN